MGAAENWVDLLDPTPAELESHLPASIHSRAVEQLLTPARHEDEPRPKLEAHGDYIFGVLLVAVAVPEDDLVYYQEVDVVLTETAAVTVRKTPENGRGAYDPAGARAACRVGDSVGMVAYHLVDDIAERFLDLVDALGDEIDELEDGVDTWGAERIRRRIADLRHDMLHIRRTLAPTRDATRQVVDGRVELATGDLFPREVALNFAAAYDKLLRAADGLELSRDLVSGVRDYQQSKIANDQNEVMKRLTAIAALLLVPTFIVGLYGQNFVNIPELRWAWGYAWSWGVIVVSTIGQLLFFRWKKWI